MTARLLMVALDGADSRRLDLWSRDGTLPHLAALRRAGAVRRLAAPPGATDDALWASFQYAAGEGGHGRCYHRLLDDEDRLQGAAGEAQPREPFWQALGRAGLRTAIFDVPKCPAPQPLNGIHLADWLVHGRYFKGPRSHPDGLADAVLARFGAAPPSVCSYHQPDLDDQAMLQIEMHLHISIAQKRAAALHHLAAEPWDLFVVGFKEGHCACHGLWHLEDPAHPEFDAARSARLGWPLRRLFTALDAAIRDLVVAAGEGARVVVFSTTAIEPNGSLEHLWPQVAVRLAEAASAAFGIRPVLIVVPHGDNAGALRVRGIADPDLRDRMLAWMGRALGALIDARTQQPVVSAVRYPSSEVVGPRAAALPHILALYRPGITPDVVASQQLGRIEKPSARRRPGNHAGDGLAILAPDSGALDIGAIQDLGPFAAHVLGAVR